MVAQTAWRSHNNMRAAVQCAAFVTHIHATNSRSNLGSCVAIEPNELAFHLQGKLARRRNHQGQRGGRGAKGLSLAQNRASNREAKAHGLARTRLRRDEHVSAF